MPTPQQIEGSNAARNWAKGYNLFGPRSKNYQDYIKWYEEEYPKVHGGQPAPATTSDPAWGGKMFADFTPQERINWWLWKIPPGTPGVPTTRDDLSDATIDSLNDAQVGYYLRTGKDPSGLTADQMNTFLNKWAYQSGVGSTGQGAMYYYLQPGLWDSIPEDQRPAFAKATSQNTSIEPGLWELLSSDVRGQGGTTYSNPSGYWNSVRRMLDQREVDAGTRGPIYYSPNWDSGTPTAAPEAGLPSAPYQYGQTPANMTRAVGMPITSLPSYNLPASTTGTAGTSLLGNKQTTYTPTTAAAPATSQALARAYNPFPAYNVTPRAQTFASPLTGPGFSGSNQYANLSRNKRKTFGAIPDWYYTR